MARFPSSALTCSGRYWCPALRQHGDGSDGELLRAQHHRPCTYTPHDTAAFLTLGVAVPRHATLIVTPRVHIASVCHTHIAHSTLVSLPCYTRMRCPLIHTCECHCVSAATSYLCDHGAGQCLDPAGPRVSCLTAVPELAIPEHNNNNRVTSDDTSCLPAAPAALHTVTYMPPPQVYRSPVSVVPSTHTHTHKRQQPATPKETAIQSQSSKKVHST